MRLLLDEKQRQLKRDETSLDVVQELLQCIPIPVVGVDGEGMVVFANGPASHLLGREGELLGLFAAECLPPPLLALVERGEETATVWRADGREYRVDYRRLGHAGDSRGGMLFLVPPGGES